MAEVFPTRLGPIIACILSSSKDIPVFLGLRSAGSLLSWLVIRMSFIISFIERQIYHFCHYKKDIYPSIVVQITTILGPFLASLTLNITTTRCWVCLQSVRLPRQGCRHD